ncbi:MAG: hypothetical protein ABSG63_05535 [Spirochaetia bacterium]|jgi:hypothetical protein
MKVRDEVRDLTPQEQAVQALAYTLVLASNPYRATGKPEECKKKPKVRRKRA